MVKKVAGTDEDFEFYPTTNEILNVLCRHADLDRSVLDIGAGTGKVLERFKYEKFIYKKPS